MHLTSPQNRQWRHNSALAKGKNTAQKGIIETKQQRNSQFAHYLAQIAQLCDRGQHKTFNIRGTSETILLIRGRHCAKRGHTYAEISGFVRNGTTLVEPSFDRWCWSFLMLLTWLVGVVVLTEDCLGNRHCIQRGWLNRKIVFLRCLKCIRCQLLNRHWIMIL